MNKFKTGDIIVRCYKNGREAICIFVLDEKNNISMIGYLDESFYEDGGLIRLDFFGMGIDSYNYRYATFYETCFILNELKKYKERNNNIKFMKYFNDLNEIIEFIIKYKIAFRKDKLEKIKKYEET